MLIRVSPHSPSLPACKVGSENWGKYCGQQIEIAPYESTSVLVISVSGPASYLLTSTHEASRSSLVLVLELVRVCVLGLDSGLIDLL